jgi:uncharacterized protein
VNATPNQLQDLLELNAIDQLILKSRTEAEQLGQDQTYVKLQADLKATSGEFIAANNVIDGLKLDLKRLESDVELVDKRMAKDIASLRTTSVVKDAQGLQHEMRTLERRKQELEDQELEIMEGLEQATANLSGISSRRAEIETNLRTVIEGLNREKARLVSGIDLAQANRKQLVSKLPGDLVEIFEAKRKRSVPIGRLINSECGACRMSISATNLAGIIKAPVDQLVFCPDCSAILVR